MDTTHGKAIHNVAPVVPKKQSSLLDKDIESSLVEFELD